MSQDTPRLSLPLMQGAQAQKHVTHNEALELLDIAVHLTLTASDATTPPAAPAEGDAWGVATGAVGAWSGKGGRIACWRGGGWLFVAPKTGWRAWCADTGDLRVRTTAGWIPLPGGAAPDLNDVPQIGIGAAADATNRLVVASDAVLLTHAGSGHQVKINKAGPTDTASLVYQTNYGGRAEMGLAGNDDFAVKVSADGAVWTDALRIAGIDGAVTLAHVLTLTPGAEPAAPVAGQIYFDAGAATLRCHDGSVWRDLF